jgi:hypothetical protein
VTTTIPKDIRLEFERKIKRGIFVPVARFVHENLREDQMQEAIGFTWLQYKQHAENGEILDDALLVHICRLRATDLGRRLACGDRRRRRRDAFDQRNFNRRRVELWSLGDYATLFEENPPADNTEASSDIGRARSKALNPTNRIIGAISLNEWLDSLDTEDRELIELRAAGYDLDEIAGRLGSSRFEICRRVKKLGLSLAEHADMPDMVRRRQSTQATATEERAPESGIPESGVPESGVRAKTRGRPKKAQAPFAITQSRPSRRVRRAA